MKEVPHRRSNENGWPFSGPVVEKKVPRLFEEDRTSEASSGFDRRSWR